MRNHNAPIRGASCRDPWSAGRWYIVHTNASAERMAVCELLDADFVLHYPHFETTRRHGRRTTTRMAPLYPRYLFVAVQEGQALWDINRTPGVAGVVCRGPAPIEVPAPVMAEEVERTDDDGRLTQDELRRLGMLPPGKFVHGLRVGQRVRFQRGPFADLVGVVGRLDKDAALRVWLDVLGRTTPVRAVEGDLVPLSNG